MRFMNQANGYVKTFSSIRLWYFFFGIFYLMHHGLWKPFWIVIFTGGFAHLYYIFALPGVIRSHYMDLGWIED